MLFLSLTLLLRNEATFSPLSFPRSYNLLLLSSFGRSLLGVNAINPLTLGRERGREREGEDPFPFATDAEMSSWAQEMGTPVEKEEDEGGAVNCLIFLGGRRR